MLDGFGVTQRKILESLLQNKKGMTIDELVNILDITRTAVNQHINTLTKDGYLQKHTQIKTGGRPGQIYVLTEKGIHLFPKQYAWFSELLLNNIKQLYGSRGLEDMLIKLGEQVADQHSSRLEGKTAAAKVAAIAELMLELGYQSSANEDGTQINACNCVFHELALENPEVCTFDLALLSAMSNSRIEQVACMAHGHTKCRFKIIDELRPYETSSFHALPKGLVKV